MRLWSLHPRYLDTKGLVAVWREGLLALHVLSGKTTAYQHHPQLIRFTTHEQPLLALNMYLHEIVDEADIRGYHFKREKLGIKKNVSLIQITLGQVIYETAHLRKKLQVRDEKRFSQQQDQPYFDVHPLFLVVNGPLAEWERPF